MVLRSEFFIRIICIAEAGMVQSTPDSGLDFGVARTSYATAVTFSKTTRTWLSKNVSDVTNGHVYQKHLNGLYSDSITGTLALPARRLTHVLCVT